LLLGGSHLELQRSVMSLATLTKLASDIQHIGISRA